MYLVDCWIEHQTLKIDHIFTYISEVFIDSGIRIKVNFNNKDVVALVDKSTFTNKTKEDLEKEAGYKIKEVKQIIDNYPILTDELFSLAKWLAKDTISPTISCFKTMLPSKIKPTTNKQKISYIKMIKTKKTNIYMKGKQLEAYNYILDNEPLQYKNFKYRNQIKFLKENDLVEIYEVEKTNSLKIQQLNKTNKLKLTSQQKQAFDKIRNSIKNIILLHGVTGSGKTEIYLQLAQEVIKDKKQVLFLVPEISLTPQMIKRVKERFIDNIAIYHSGLNPQEKYEQYKKILNNEVDIVVGTRSSVFLPFSNLGLIIMDEEHDLSYKQDNMPCYHCRDIAIKRIEYFNAKLVLGSATPSLDSYARAIKNVYELVEIKERVNNTLAKIQLVNVTNSKTGIISKMLQEKIQDRLSNNQQVILLLNRRGFLSSLHCSNCNKVLMCPHCDISLSYHKDIKMLKCHICNSTFKVPNMCDNCKSINSFIGLGYGTQKLEIEIKKLFKNARVLRMDFDTTRLKNSHEKILDSFSKHEYDILIGTQMISKGLDYPNVSLVGIINGDAGLSRTDYRSQEITFDLLVQSSGRSGRSNIDGEVVIQVYDENSYVIKSAVKQDYINFFKYEMNYRKIGNYPPYTYLISLIIINRKKEVIDKDVINILKELKGEFKILGPSDLIKINDQFRSRIILKGKNINLMKEELYTCLKNIKIISNIKIDINPLVLE